MILLSYLSLISSMSNNNGCPKKVSPFEHFQKGNHCLVLNDVNSNNLLKGQFGFWNTNFPIILRWKNPGMAKNLAMEICLIPSMFYITGVKAYIRLSISQLSIQIWQYARTTGPCLVSHTFSSYIKQNLAFYGPNRKNMIFLGSLY